MSTQICSTCNNQKKLVGSGGMWVDCYTCNGTGYTVQEEEESIKSHLESHVVQKTNLAEESIILKLSESRGKPKKHGRIESD